MKPRLEQIDALGSVLRERREVLGLSVTEIGRSSGVHASQVGRILAGQFRTISNNVVQICTVLGVSPASAASSDSTCGKKPRNRCASSPTDEAAERLQRQILVVWDRTPDDAERLTTFLRQLAGLRRFRGGKWS